jgi:hypothetical protein
MRPFMGMMGMVEPWEGAQTSLYAALASDIEAHPGAYYSQTGTYRDKTKNAGGRPPRRQVVPTLRSRQRNPRPGATSRRDHRRATHTERLRHGKNNRPRLPRGDEVTLRGGLVKTTERTQLRVAVVDDWMAGGHAVALARVCRI